ncbi:MAG: CRISPR-associated protein Cas4 [Candidatus Thermoplasmatota archaeon]|nr:CRISPR-associated protein Cas4 [Candidatus Thermoplasmatota archaeon]MBU4143543.1 CRISPR-associated protein Cas4 [Candidatus Thermoplasmatota archaeon]
MGSNIIPTGKAAFYLHSCPVLTWLYLHGQLVVASSHIFIKSGKELDTQRFSNKRSIDLTPYGKADWVTGTQTTPIIHEGSRGKRHNEPKRAQLRHYLWAAKQLYNIDAVGELHLKQGNVERVEPDHDSVERDHARLLEIMKGSMPQPQKIPICKGCTNKDWCWQ